MNSMMGYRGLDQGHLVRSLLRFVLENSIGSGNFGKCVGGGIFVPIGIE